MIIVCPWTCKTMNTYHLIDTSQFNKGAKRHKSCHPNNANEPNCTTALSLFIVFLERGVFSSLDQFGTWWCVLVVMCFRGLSGVWSWSEMPGSVSQPWFCSKFLFFFVWFLRSDDAPHPLWLLCLCIRSCFIPHSYVWSCTARSRILKEWSGVRVCVCLRASVRVCVRCCCCCCSSEDLHLDVLFTLYSTSCLCVSVWTGSSCIARFLSSLLPLPSFSVWYVFDWVVCQTFFFGFVLFWLVSCCIRCLLIGTPLVMWCALDWLCIIWVWPLSILLHCV